MSTAAPLFSSPSVFSSDYALEVYKKRVRQATDLQAQNNLQKRVHMYRFHAFQTYLIFDELRNLSNPFRR